MKKKKPTEPRECLHCGQPLRTSHRSEYCCASHKRAHVANQQLYLFQKKLEGK